MFPAHTLIRVLCVWCFSLRQYARTGPRIGRIAWPTAAGTFVAEGEGEGEVGRQAGQEGGREGKAKRKKKKESGEDMVRGGEGRETGSGSEGEAESGSEG